MVEQDASNAAQIEFRRLVSTWASVVGDPAISADAVNVAVDAMRTQIEDWDKNGISRSILVPFLTDDAPANRCVAAIFLLDRGEAQQAVSTLRALVDGDYGSMSSEASTALWSWENEQDARP